MHTLENDVFQFTLRPDSASFDLQPRTWPHPMLRGARLSAAYRVGGSRFEALNDGWAPYSLQPERLWGTAQGDLHAMRVAIGPDEQGVSFEITFALPHEAGLFLWKVAVRNTSPQPIFLDRVTLLEAGERLNGGRVWLPSSAQAQHAWYSHGWQSWNYTAAYASDQGSRRTRLGLLEAPMYICDGTPQPSRPGHYSADFFGALVDRGSRAGFLAGFLSQKQHFGSLEAFLEDRLALRMWANGDGVRVEPGGVVETDWAIIQVLDLEQPQPLDPFLEAAARENAVKVPREVLPGWCSWYYYYQKVTAEAVRQNLDAVQAIAPRLPLDLVQIDDGFEAQIGDWFDFHPSFPEGVAPLAQEIHAAARTPGLWLAPFIVHPKSRLAVQHPDWLLRDRRGRLVRSGFNWNAITNALDLSVPAALEYACAVVDRAAHDWGYPYLKLDFLYAGGLAGSYHDPHLSRAQVLRRGLEALRAAAGPETTLLGCGVPLGTALGLFEAMRIGADVAGTWQPRYLGTSLFFGAEPHMPAVRNALQNTLTRAPMHGRWWINDPDCLLVRPDTDLTLAEVQSFATAIGITGGSLLLSDDLPALPPERLRIAEALLPVVGQRPQVLDLFDRENPARLRLDLCGPSGEWHVLALFNWEDEPRELLLQAGEFQLPAVAYRLRSFWDGRVLDLPPGGSLNLGQVPAHGCVLLAARPVGTAPQYAGSDLHFSQGVEVGAWDASPDGVRFVLDLPPAREGWAALWLPSTPRRVTVDGEESIWKKQDGLTLVPVKGTSQVDIAW